MDATFWIAAAVGTVLVVAVGIYFYRSRSAGPDFGPDFSADEAAATAGMSSVERLKASLPRGYEVLEDPDNGLVIEARAGQLIPDRTKLCAADETLLITAGCNAGSNPQLVHGGSYRCRTRDRRMASGCATAATSTAISIGL